MRRIAILAVMVALAGCHADFRLFDASAPVLDARFSLDSAGPGRLPYTWIDTALPGNSIRMLADTLVFSPDGQVTRRWSAYFFFPNAGHVDSALYHDVWQGQYDLTSVSVRTWLEVGNPVALSDTLARQGDTVLIANGDFVIHTRMRYRRVTP